MDWIRRNWPDLLIGVALFSVITGIIATLLSGGTILPERTSTSANDFELSAQSAQPSPSYQRSVNVAGEPTTVSTRSLYGESVTANASAVTVLSPQRSSEPRNSHQSSINAQVSPPVVSPNRNVETSALAADNIVNNQIANNQNSTTKIYKLSAGAFGNPINAKNSVVAIEGMGYKTWVEQSGNLSLVYVGPFSQRQQAEFAASQLRAANYETNVYSVDSETPATTVNQARANQSTTPSTSRPSVEPSVEPAFREVVAGNSYLQVGAYHTNEHSAPHRNQLEQLGYTVIERRENGLLKLILGPYRSNEVSIVKTQLKAKGFDSFVRN